MIFLGTFLFLTKLSLGHNNISIFPNLDNCLNLTELRINNNLIVIIPQTILNNKKIKTLDLSNNLITEWSNVQLLSGLLCLTNLGFKGNP